MRVVLDVNVLVSGLISNRGSPARILELWKSERFELITSLPILEELTRVLHYPRIQGRYHLPEDDTVSFLGLVGSLAVVVNPDRKLDVIPNDPTDNRYLECATAGEVKYLVSGDQHLLKLKEFEGVVILPPSGFVALLEAGAA